MIVAVVVGFVHGGEELFDAGGQRVDLGGQCVDLTQKQPGQLGVMIIEATIQRGDQLGALGFHPSAGQIGESARVSLPGDEGIDHVPRGQGV